MNNNIFKNPAKSETVSMIPPATSVPEGSISACVVIPELVSFDLFTLKKTKKTLHGLPVSSFVVTFWISGKLDTKI